MLHSVKKYVSVKDIIYKSEMLLGVLLMSESAFRIILLFSLFLIACVGIFIGLQLKEMIDAIAFLAART